MTPALMGDDGVAAGAAGRSLHDTAVLNGDAACVAQARRRAAGFLDLARAEHGVPVSRRACDLLQLVVSELVTNACKYAGGPIRLDLRIASGLVEVAVRDGNPALPVVGTADASRVGRHGLEIVSAVCRSFEAVAEAAGKRLTARLPLTEGAAA
ncbi:ATP-binding protein [Streptomyces mangrovisoli]|uniref:ATP-binding protein n=1 Tax=Streptomyces mangrovisoli TaxID=1428628 RepID=A0A1J4NP90_9ACTN|nr:ATP-binding protein [Streptomyces mangrovisoli]OIJ64123.1 ATP-binding protein [Streptomyces mangrovisoli]